ncbi:hypothetical protein ACFX12_040427 [Malus domestica]
MCRNEKDLISTDLTISSFSGAITRTHGILPMEVDLGSKKIMLAFFIVDSTSTYGALLGKDWIHQNLFVPSTLHQQVAVYHETMILGDGEGRVTAIPPHSQCCRSHLYNPSIGILQCLEAEENGRPTKVTAQKLLEQGLFLTKEEWDRPYIVLTPQHQ